MWRRWKISLNFSKAFDLHLIRRSHSFLREQYNHVRDKISGLGPLVLTEYEFAAGVAHQTVKKSKHEVMNRDLRAISGRIDHATDAVDALEEHLSINTRWQRGNAEYVKMRKYIDNRKFVRIIEWLQGLVVSRLMELDKMNLASSGAWWVSLCEMSLMFLLGYKLHKHIALALSRRCVSIRNAISCYNDLAPLQKPPRPLLVYSEVVDYCTFSEFEILKHSDHDVLSKEWAILANRQAASKYFKIERAKEEIHRCNIEVTRVQAWVDKEDMAMSEAVANHERSDPAFAAHLKVLQTQRHHVNNHLRTCLEQIYKLPGYSGPHVTTSSTPPAPSTVPSATLQTRVEGHVDGDHIDDEDGPHEDKDKDEMLRMVDTLAKIMV